MAVAANLHLKRLEEHGWCILRGAFPKWAEVASLAWLERMAERTQHEPSLQVEFEWEPVDRRRPVRRLRRLLWSDQQFWLDLLSRSGLLGLGAAFVPGEPAVVGHTAFLKPARVGSEVYFHQDQRLWRSEWPGAVSVWVALSPADATNGCLRVCPGSHRLGPLPHEWEGSGRPVPAVKPGVGDIPEQQDVPMQPGDVIVWHRYLVHGSGPNRSERPRRGMVLVFADASAPGFEAEEVVRLEPSR